MAAAMLRLLRDANLYLALKNNGIESVKQYTWPFVKQQLFTVYAHLSPAAKTLKENSFRTEKSV